MPTFVLFVFLLVFAFNCDIACQASKGVQNIHGPQVLSLLDLTGLANGTFDWCTANIKQGQNVSVRTPRLPPNTCFCTGTLDYPIMKCVNARSGMALRKNLHIQTGVQWFGKFILANGHFRILHAAVFPEDKYFEYISIKKTKIVKIAEGTFAASGLSLRRLEIIHNNLKEFPFTDLQHYKQLQHLDLFYNSLTSVPDYAFKGMSQLKTIDLSYNHISYVGSFAIYDLPLLSYVDMRFNRLKVINNNAFSLKDTNLKLTIDLSNNEIKFVANDSFVNQSPEVLDVSWNNMTVFSDDVFGPMLDALSMRKGGKILLTGNPFQCDCNNMAWLLDAPQVMKRKAAGLKCHNLKNKPLTELTKGDLVCERD